MSRKVQRSVYLTPEQDSAIQSMRPSGMPITDFLIQAMTKGVQRVRAMPVAKFDEWGLVSQLIRDDGDYGWLGRVGHDLFTQDIPRAMVLAAEASGLRGTALVASMARNIKAQDLLPARSDDYVFASASDVGVYSRNVIAAANRRRLIRAAEDMTGRLYEEDDPDAAATAMAGQLSAMRAEERGTGILEALEEGAMEAKRDEEDDRSGTRLSLGFDGFERLIPRLRGGEVVVVAARTNVGKSLILSNIAHRNAESGNPVAIFSLEMRRSQVAERIASVDSGAPSYTAEGLKNYGDREFLRGCENASKLPIHIDDRASLTVSQIWTSVMAMSPKPRLVMVDYLQLVKHSPTADNLNVAIGQTMKALLAMSKELSVATVAFAQINRAGGEMERPKVSHLRDSGDIEQDAHYIVLGRFADDGRRTTIWEVAKNRNFANGFGEVVLERYKDSARMIEV